MASTSVHGNLPVTGELSLQRQPLSEMSSSKVVRAINRLAREGLDLLGTSALLNFVEEYLCGDDPDNDEALSSGKYRVIRKHYFYPTHSCTDETEDALATAGNTIINIAHNTYIKLNLN